MWLLESHGSEWHCWLFGSIYGLIMGFPGSSVAKNLPTMQGDTALIPGSGRFPGEGNGNPLQYACLESPVVRRAWGATVYVVTEGSEMT